MRALSEQPRVTAAKLLMVVTLVAAGMAVGVLLGARGGKGAQATQAAAMGGMAAAIISGFVGLIVGTLLGIAITKS